MAAKDWHRKYSMMEAEGKRLKRQRGQQRSQQRHKLSKEQVRSEILKRQAERKRRQEAEEVAISG